jgi:hypothetical protein
MTVKAGIYEGEGKLHIVKLYAIVEIISEPVRAPHTIGAVQKLLKKVDLSRLLRNITPGRYVRRVEFEETFDGVEIFAASEEGVELELLHEFDPEDIEELLK